MDEDTVSFEQFFSEEGYAEEHRAVFAHIWNAALESAKNELDDEYHWLMDNIKAKA